MGGDRVVEPLEMNPRERFMAWESTNDYPRARLGSTLDPRYRPAPGREFTVKVLEIPTADLHVVDSGEENERARRAIYTDGGASFRFPVHPESESLYADLIARYGVAFEGRASPTASGRTVWLHEGGLFAKLSLDRVQDGLGRAVPDWEVRRAVGVSRLARSIPATEMTAHGAGIIPEIAGAYIHLDPRCPAPSYIDREQGVVFQHGTVYRPADFLDDYPGKDILPAFALFSSRGSDAPMIVEWWREVQGGTSLSFEEFVDTSVIAPVVRALAYLVFVQGLLPDAHLQNLVFVANRKTRRIETVLFRDLGGVKVNLELRWSRGLPVEALRGASAAFDYKFEWAAEMSRRPFYLWFNRYTFSDEYGYGRVLREHVKGYGPMAMARLIDARVRLALEEHFPEAFASGAKTVRACVERHLDLHPPRLASNPSAAERPRLHTFIERQTRHGQVMPLRSGWFGGDNPVATEYGVAHAGPSGPCLALMPAVGLAPDTRAPAHFEVDATVGEILGAAKAVRLAVGSGLSATGPASGSPVRTLRLGTPEAPTYFVVDKEDLTRVARMVSGGARTVRLEVLHNWSSLDGPAQRRLVRRFTQGLHD